MGKNTQKTPIDFEKSFKVPDVKRFSDILRRELQKEGIHVLFSKGTTLESKHCILTYTKEANRGIKAQYLQEILLQM